MDSLYTMVRFCSIAAVIAMTFLPLPLRAQQDTIAGDRVTEDAGQGTAADTANRPSTAVPGAEDMGADSANLGRQAEGVAPERDTRSDSPGETARGTGSVLAKVLIALVVLALFGVALRWLMGRRSSGTPRR